ncbi:probable inactive ATP-dependent zinc metalloprotease FTSHI 5, chloroplastic isoform X2 [Elaeis guineensis]|uniref:probable inactive ATP-dependent zinc metalloprotease FTSHI 5, chloroplastic isoform X2 n=1 Tax=Elaeis guineensis var. tenera TaxID=51953 RepID=UPI003C6CDAFA
MESTILSSLLPSTLSFPLRRCQPRRHRWRPTASSRPPNLCLPPINLSVSTSPTLPNPQSFEKSPNFPKNGTNFLDLARKPIALVLFCAAVGFLPMPAARFHAIAAPVGVASREEVKTQKGESSKDHEFSDYTQRLLAVVSVLLQRIEEVRSSKGDMDGVREALKEVKEKREEIQEEVLEKLNSELRELKREKEELIDRSGEVLDSALAARKERDWLLESEGGGDEVKENVERLENNMSVAEKAYNELWEKIGEIDDRILRRETLTYSIAIRELSFIERESELLVERFSRRVRRDNLDSKLKSFTTRLSRHDIQKDLETACNEYWEQILLPKVLEAENSEIYPDASTQSFAVNIRRALKESRQMQRKLETQLGRKLKKFGDEKRFLVRTSEEEVLKGFPDIELKWMFGPKEVVIPKAVSLHLFHGWKKWREEAKANLKRDILENIDYGRQYMAQRQERIILDRERVMTKTWYNDERNRWEMDPVAVPYAISKKLVGGARIRHDWAAMYLTIKGDDKEYFVDIKEFDLLFEDFGGFDALYVKMLVSGIPTAVHLMWIPFSELDIRQQLLLITRTTSRCLVGLWKSDVVSYVKDWVLSKTKITIDDLMVMIVFPMVELIIPKPIRMSLGMAWPEEVYQAVGTTWYLKWQSEAEMNHNARKKDSFRWYLGFLMRSTIFGFVLFNVLVFLKRKIPRLLGYGPLRRDPNLRKLRRVKAYFKYKLYRRLRRKKEGVDPIRSAFDQMKRVKNPPIRLDDFSSIDSMREEINDIVTCLQNPTAFQEKGARAPRGVLIVGERGTGKTSLALAIAAEAKVPLVEVKARQLEAGLWVGQSASNVRELFQTARDLAPVIIFVEDFDLFAGVRGQFIHTKKQDHEAFINQLLVELDGFEKQDGVVLMATTRNLKQIDEALQRPGRMDRVLHLQRPTQLEREKILRLAAKETMDDELIDFVDWKKVAEKTALLRPIELKLVPLALEASAFRSKFLDTDELMCYCSWFAWTRETKFPHAVWAAGRALIALLLPNFDVVDNIWLEPAAWEGIGCTKITKAKNKGSANGNLESRSYLEKKLVFCFGSYIASQMLLPFGEENFLSSSELKQAQEIATRMVIQYGWGPDDSPAIYISSKAVGTLSMGNNHEFEMAAKVEKMYNLAYDKARDMLQKNRQVLEKIVEQLLKFENLTQKELLNILEDYGGTLEQEPFFLSKHYYKELTSGTSLYGDGNSQVLDLLGAST